MIRATLALLLLATLAAAGVEVIIEPRVYSQGNDTWNRLPTDMHRWRLERKAKRGNRTYRSGVVVDLERPIVWDTPGTPVRGEHALTFRVWTNRKDRVVTGMKVRLRFKWRRKIREGASYFRSIEKRYETNWEETVVFQDDGLHVGPGDTFVKRVVAGTWSGEERSMWRDAISTAGTNWVYAPYRVGYRYFSDLKCEAKLIYVKHGRP